MCRFERFLRLGFRRGYGTLKFRITNSPLLIARNKDSETGAAEVVKSMVERAMRVL